MSVQIGMPQLQLDDASIARVADSALVDQERLRSADVEVDLWCKATGPLPPGAVTVLVHEVFFQIEWFEQIIWFSRTESHDQLWAFTDFECDTAGILETCERRNRAQRLRMFATETSCELSVPRARTFDESLIELLVSFLSTPAGHPYDIDQLVATGHINKRHYRILLDRIDRDDRRKAVIHEENCRQARANETEIVHVAGELGLNPEPAGVGPVHWYARCPARGGHRIMMTTSDDRFFCGYCKVSGGVEELREFAAKGVNYVRHA